MLNWLLPLDYLYSWTESIITPKLAPVKEYRAVVIMAYAVALLSSSSFLAGGTCCTTLRWTLRGF